MKKAFKIITILTMLLLTVFASGCGKSQEEKYTEARNEFVTLQEQFTNDFYKIANKPKPTKQERAKNDEEYFNLINNFEKEADKKLQNMAEIAKGKLELTKDLTQLKQEYKENNKIHFMLRDLRKEKMKEKK